MQKEMRHKRFMDLITSIRKEKINSMGPLSKPDEREPQFVGIITGCNLFWARGRFEHSCIQMNNFNKLKIEIYSKLETPIRIS